MPEDLPAADQALVVLGAAVRRDGTPSPALARRIALAARLHREGVALTVIASGGLGRHPPAEAQAIRDGLLAAGVPPAAVIEEDRARSTYENARTASRSCAPAASAAPSSSPTPSTCRGRC